MNPFSSRAMIKDPRLFSGRTEELKAITSLFLTMQSCSIVGPRRIGKSSLLYYMANSPDAQREFPPEYRFVFLDLQELSGAKVDDFFITILDRMMKAVPELGTSDDASQATHMAGFRRIMGRITDLGLKLVLCLDEFEMLSQNSNFPAEFFTFLRGLCSNYNLILLTSSRKSLFDLCHQGDIQTSQLWNIFVELPLGLMTPKEAHELISRYFEFGNLEVDLDLVKSILVLTGYHPFFMQIAFYYLFNTKESHSDVRLESIQNLYYTEARRHYVYAWEQLEGNHKQVLGQMITSSISMDNATFQYLKRETFIQGTKEKPEFTSKGLEDFVREQFSTAIMATPDYSQPTAHQKQETLEYLDFDLLIDNLADTYRARVINSPAGQATASFSFPFQPLEMENFLLRIGRPRRSTRKIETSEVDAIKDFGSRLFNSIFKDDVMQSLRSSLDEAYRQGAGLRVRLRLGDSPQLMDLPWEFLYYQSLNRFLSLSVESPIVRFLDLPEFIRPIHVAPPIRILFVVSSAKDYMKLDVDQEWRKINLALAEPIQKGHIAIDLLTNPTQAKLLRALRRSEYHILHFVGHGGFDSKSEEGILILEDENGNGNPVSGSRIGTMLHDERTLRLVILNACEGARTSLNDPFAGVAQTIIQQGIPAVIAMQFEITDEAAIAFSNAFYSTLAEGLPVDFAITEARKEIFANGNDVEWGTPVLYLRSPDGKIFEIE